MTAAYIFHVVLDTVLLQVGRGLGSVEPLCGVQISLFEVIPVDLQLVLRVRTKVDCWERRQRREQTHLFRVLRYSGLY